MKKKKIKNILAIIPARSGSVTVKNKNIIKYKNKPLLAHSIIVAKKSKLIKRVIVSTDSKKYQIIAKKFGAETPFLRPKKISGSKSLDIELVKHCFEFIKKDYYPDIIVLLRPTSPDRNVKVVDQGIRYFIKHIKKYDSMRSASLFNQPPQKLFSIKKNALVGFFEKKLKGEYHSLPRQFYPKTYLPNGYVDILKPSFFANKKKLFGKILPFLTAEIKDIDEKKDIKI